MTLKGLSYLCLLCGGIQYGWPLQKGKVMDLLTMAQILYLRVLIDLLSIRESGDWWIKPEDINEICLYEGGLNSWASLKGGE